MGETRLNQWCIVVIDADPENVLKSGAWSLVVKQMSELIIT